MGKRLVAEIPELTASWKISFDLKPTRFSKHCAKNSANSILQVNGGERFPMTQQPEIKFSCKQERSLIEPECCSILSIRQHSTTCKRHGKYGWTKDCMSHSSANHAAKIAISHVINGGFFRREPIKNLKIGSWHRFEMSQAREIYQNKKRLMFKVVVDGEVLLHKEQRKPFEGPVKVLAASGRIANLPAVMKNVKIELAGAVVAHTRYNWGASGWKAAVTDRKVWDKRIVDGSECCQVCREKFPETKTWQKFKNYNRCSCLSFDDHFDPSKYERSHGSYSIGSCEEAQIFRQSNMG